MAYARATSGARVDRMLIAEVPSMLEAVSAAIRRTNERIVTAEDDAAPAEARDMGRFTQVVGYAA
jgi:hypothetical protein